MAVAKTKCEEILSKLNYYSVNNEFPDEFTLAKLKREIESLKNSSPAENHQCEAILHTLSNNYEGVKNSYSMVISYMPENSDVHENYAISLRRLYRLNESLTHLQKAFNISKISKDLLHLLASNIHVTFRYDILNDALAAYTKATGDTEILKSEDIQSSLEIEKMLRLIDIDPIDANKIYSAVEDVVLQFNIPIVNGVAFPDNSSGTTHMSMYAGVNASADDISNMNNCLAEQLVDRDITHLLSKMTYAFVPQEGIN